MATDQRRVASLWNFPPVPPSQAPQPAWPAKAWRDGWRSGQVALALTTYRANLLLLLGRDLAGGLSLQERLFDRPMGLFAEGDDLWMATRSQIWRLHNHLAPGRLWGVYLLGFSRCLTFVGA